jgi:transposase-like protein
MRRYSEAVKAEVRRRMSPPHRQSVAQISAELGIHIVTLYKWRQAWRLQGEVVPASQMEPVGWSAADKFTVVLETAGSAPLSYAPTAMRVACTRSRWNVGVRRPRLPIKSQSWP